MPVEAARRLEEGVEAADAVGVARLITDHAADAIFLLDSEGKTTFANPSAEDLFGWSAAELKGNKLHDLVHHHHPDGEPFPMSECPLGQVFATGRTLKLHEDVFFHRDGRQVPVACSNAAILRDGVVVGSVLIVRDITERHIAEKHRQLLIGELSHRVKNILAVVQSIAEQSLKGDGLAEVRGAFSERIRALAIAQELLSENEGVAALLGDSIHRALAPFAIDGRVSVNGPQLLLEGRMVTALAMAVHELATNACKYGALSAAGGQIAITWASPPDDDAPQFTLRWEEFGGPAVQPPTGRGFGSKMIERVLAAEFDGKVAMDFRPSGLICTVIAPLPSDPVASVRG